MALCYNDKNLWGEMNMGELFLSGGGNAKQTYVIDTHFVRNIRKDKPLLYIPIAMDASRFDDCLTWIQLVNGYAIWCHYNEGNDLLIQNYMKKYETPVICLPEETAVIVNDSVIKVIGDKYAYTFRDGSKTIFHPGNVIT